MGRPARPALRRVAGVRCRPDLSSCWPSRPPSQCCSGLCRGCPCGDPCWKSLPALIGPPVLAWVHPDETLSVLGLSFLLFLAGFEVDIRRFRGRTGRHVALALAGSIALATAVGAAFSAVGVRGGLLVAIALLATSVG